MRARFRNIEAELPRETVDRLDPAGWALWYAAQEREKADAVASDAMLPAWIVDQATELKYRMAKVVGYNVGERRDAAAKVAHVVSGNGYLDLASDLGGLADLYDENAAELAKDQKYYASADAPVARRLAGQIVTLLGQHGDAGRADAVDRSYALVNSLYLDIRPFAHALFRRENPERSYPTLFSVRARPSLAREQVEQAATDLLGEGGR